ncbi:NAD-dependent epimerase/dehydratase family protein [Nitrogeniibacter mangrovi]|uniref:NAD-dependent epimerase/dehydratase family protein n=1 Tax=Nitrogeniibacter mangrovi TaxID=2016596 RepID=A0A6C1AZU9_9RHOO|nr:NAD-dependent epimerase/dehydratase family protein [Nitrogeniibacter mangrovi]QID16882.1 NAD-dependent epimerase/dehydratase family protein [Nitrogeniibacter mangrovi]
MQTVLIVGCGDVAQRALPWLLERFRVIAMIRDEAQRVALRKLGVRTILADLDDRRSLRRIAGLADYVIHTAPPPRRGLRDLRTRALIAALARRGSLPRRLVYISTTGVYGDCGGALVAETRPAAPESDRAIRRVDAERALRAFARRCRIDVVTLRAPGIYAADRLPVERLERRDPALVAEDDVFTNHIHADDLARLATLALNRGGNGRVWNASDDTDLRMADYFDAVADHLGLARPPRVSRRELASRVSPMTLSFMRESRRLDNRRVKRELRARLTYPDIHAGLAAVPRIVH